MRVVHKPVTREACYYVRTYLATNRKQEFWLEGSIHRFKSYQTNGYGDSGW